MAEEKTVITGIEIPFLQLVWFMVKASFAAAIAATITSVLWAIIGAVVFALMTALGTALLAMLGLGGAALVHSVPPPTSAVAPTAVSAPAPAPGASSVAPSSASDAGDGCFSDGCVDKPCDFYGGKWHSCAGKTCPCAGH